MFPGFTKRKNSTINNGDWDRDGVRNRKDCEPLNFRKQGPEHDEKYDEDRRARERQERERRAMYEKDLTRLRRQFS